MSKTKSTTKLLPCPFDSGAAKPSSFYDPKLHREMHVIICCKCGASTQPSKIPATADNRWNKRKKKRA